MNTKSCDPTKDGHVNQADAEQQHVWFGQSLGTVRDLPVVEILSMYEKIFRTEVLTSQSKQCQTAED